MVTVEAVESPQSGPSPARSGAYPSESSEPPNAGDLLERVLSQLLLVAEATGSLPSSRSGASLPIAHLQVNYAAPASGAGELASLYAPALSLLLGAVIPAIKSDAGLSVLLGQVRGVAADPVLMDALVSRMFGQERAAGTRRAASARPAASPRPRHGDHADRARAPGSLLTQREIAVLQEATRACSQESIADTLGISARTVGTHFENIYRKLGVNKPLQAVIKGIEQGYIHIAAPAAPPPYMSDRVARRLLEALTPALPGDEIRKTPSGDGSQPEIGGTARVCADMGLLLLLLSAALALYDAEPAAPAGTRNSLLGRMESPEGDLTPFGGDFVADACSIAVAPPHAQGRGFAPGHVFVADAQAGLRGLNGAHIVEFTPAGRFVRCFAGARSVTSSLLAPVCLAFAGDGRLLATTSGVMEGILTFSKGGRKVEVFTEGRFTRIVGGARGTVYAASAAGLHRFTSAGEPLDEPIHWRTAGECVGLTTAADGTVCALIRSGESCVMEQYGPDGAFIRAVPLPDEVCSIASQEHGGFWAASQHAVHCLDKAGRKVRTHRTGPEFVLRELVAAGPSVYVCGSRAE